MSCQWARQAKRSVTTTCSAISSRARYEQEHPNELHNLLLQYRDRIYTAGGMGKSLCSLPTDRRYRGYGRSRRESWAIIRQGFSPGDLASWIDALPEEIFADRPTLLSHKGAVLGMKGQVENGITYLDRAEATLRACGENYNLASTLARTSNRPDASWENTRHL